MWGCCLRILHKAQDFTGCKLYLTQVVKLQIKLKLQHRRRQQGNTCFQGGRTPNGTVRTQDISHTFRMSPARGGQETRNRWQWLEVVSGYSSLFIPLCTHTVSSLPFWNLVPLLTSGVHIFCIPSLLQLKQLSTCLASSSKPHEAGFTTILR